MNPWGLTSSGLLIWGLVAHLIADWPLQNDWMARHKAERGFRLFHNIIEGNCTECAARWYKDKGNSGRCSGEGGWWNRHPAAWIHAGIHCMFLLFIFGWVAFPIALAHLIIDTRVPVIWWSRLIGQTQPQDAAVNAYHLRDDDLGVAGGVYETQLYSIGLEVRFWTDQVFHIACIAIAALVVVSV